ncbi:hypothetical protein [Dactylosporangium sp. NPDC000521]|uniref:hypothetical protein n=1 Tax=Dactylosporangium sp. NPDC000521 TaxID=3363975 RepID=UPI00369DA88E
MMAATPQESRAVEDAVGAALPALFRRCCLELGNGGFGPNSAIPTVSVTTAGGSSGAVERTDAPPTLARSQGTGAGGRVSMASGDLGMCRQLSERGRVVLVAGGLVLTVVGLVAATNYKGLVTKHVALSSRLVAPFSPFRRGVPDERLARREARTVLLERMLGAVLFLWGLGAIVSTLWHWAVG